jgi:hypothetical protein
MFIRFASGEIDSDARVPVGLFHALHQLYWSDEVPRYEIDALRDIENWFDENLTTLPDHLFDNRWCAEAVCWFKSHATTHLSRAWEMVEILERNDVLVWQIKGRDVGHIYYEDEAQVFARPTRAVRRLLRRQ